MLSRYDHGGRFRPSVDSLQNLDACKAFFATSGQISLGRMQSHVEYYQIPSYTLQRGISCSQPPDVGSLRNCELRYHINNLSSLIFVIFNNKHFH